MSIPWTSSRRFLTLLQREWLQQRRAWMLLVAAPPVMMLGLLMLGPLDITFDDDQTKRDLASLPPLAIAMMTILVSAVLCFLLAWAAALMQSPGLARRDRQDRSIEFWLSLPIGHSAALVSPLLAHLLLFPLAALGIGAVAGLALSPLSVARFAQPGDWFALPWGVILLAGLSFLARAALGLVLATLWLSPLVLLAMTASAWLKRWGLPALVAGIVVVGNLLDKLYGNPVVWDLGRQLLTRAGQSFVSGHSPGGLTFGPGSDAEAAVRAFPALLLNDAGHSLAALGDPLLMLALAVSAACFGLLVLRRQRA